jgi:hypothetical protein
MNEADDLREFRFAGHLGFGGKFRWSDGKMCVDCYKEDENRKSNFIVRKLNNELDRLVNLTANRP